MIYMLRSARRLLFMEFCWNHTIVDEVLLYMSFKKVLLDFKVPYHKDSYLFYMEGFIEIVGDGGFSGWNFTTLFY